MFKRLMIVVIALCAMVLVASGGNAAPFSCVSGNNVWKNDSGGVYTAPSGYIISAIWVKAGQNCYELPHACYAVASGGIGYDYVEVVDAGGCQELSHLEGTFVENEPTSTMTQEPTATVATPTVVFTPTSTPEDEVTPTTTEVPTQISPTPILEVTNTPEPTPPITPTEPPITPTEPPITPYPTKECQIEHCNGMG